MIKGDVFNKQYFPSNTFALFIDTFLANKCGIIADYKNGMNITNTTNQITISSGAACIKGRFVREDSYTTLSVSYQTTTYCVLVIEIDLDKVNTISELNQVRYYIITSESDYPTLIQTDIVKNESGKYQFELARFICNSSGINSFVDKRTFLDFNSIYAEIRRHIEDIDAGTLTTMPVGSGCDFYGSIAPTNFMFADGSAISRTEYSSLFDIIGTTYGSGDGTTTFNLPDKRERVTVMYKNGSTNGTSNATMGILGAKGGEFKHSLTSNENGTHTHSITDYGHSHAITYEHGSTGGSTAHPSKSIFYGDTPVTINTGTSNSNIIVNNSGNGVGHNNLQPYLVCNYIIRVK